MKKLILILLTIFTYIGVNGQEKIKVIYANSNNSVSLFFPSPIEKGTTGNKHFSFSYNREEESTIGLLKATPGTESNLLVITKDKNIYSFVLKYKKDRPILNHFFKTEHAIGNLKETDHQEKTSKKEVVTDSLSKSTAHFSFSGEYNTPAREEQSEMYLNDRQEYYRKYSFNESNKDPFFKRYFAANNNVRLHLQNIKYNKNELYFTLKIENKSAVDFDVNFLEFFINAKAKNKRSSSQRIPLSPAFKYNTPKRVKAFSTSIMVYTFKKFSINENKIMEIELNELKGERNIILSIPNTDINNPNN